MPAHGEARKAASGLSLARRTLGEVHGGHAVGFPQQAQPRAAAADLTLLLGPVSSRVNGWRCPGTKVTHGGIMFRIQPWFRAQGLTVCLVGSLVCSAGMTAVAGAQQDATRVPTVTLLKRIAEAVDGRRTGRSVFVVTNVDSMNVTVVVSTRAEAMGVVRRLGPRYEIHGPFRTDVNLGELENIVPSECVHDAITSAMRVKICNGAVIRLENLESLSLVIRKLDGTVRTVQLPLTTNAIFLNLSAFDKFVFPYYEKIMGLEATAAWRDRLVQELRRK